MAWSSAALWFDGPSNRWLAGTLAGAFALACAALFWRLRRFRIASLSVAGLVAVVLLWWLWIPPRNDRPWQPDVAQPAWAEFSGNQVTLHNVRNFDYRSNDEFTPNWETRAYNLDQVQGFDLFICFWGPRWIAHTIASWEFADGRHLAISIETRKERGEQYSAIRGFFRQFELYYVVADERDVVGLRAAHRGEQVYLYRVRLTPAEARAVLVDYLALVNSLARTPRWYNALTYNCTTAIRQHFSHVGDVRSLHWKILLNGYLDELLYDRHRLATDRPFAELKRASDVTDRARAAAADPAFSARIRVGLPPRPAP